MKSSMKSLFTCGTSTLCLALSISAASAQSVDYSALQQTFGEPVTTSATGKPQRASDVPADMIIITQDQIRRSGAVKITDLLKFVPGMDVRTYGDVNAEVNVHGFTQPATSRLLVLVNGRQVYLDQLGYVDWNTIPVQLGEIQQIEIVKGPGSALFGFNAASGVINIITINPHNTQMTQARVTGGSYGLFDVSGVVAHRITDDLSFRVSGGYSTQDVYSGVQTVSVMSPWKPSADNAAAEVNWQVTDKILARAEGTYARSHQLELSALAGFANMIYGTASLKGGVTADTSLGLIDFSAYYNHLKHVVYGPPGPPAGADGRLNFTDNVAVISASDLFKVGSDVAVRIGGEYRFNKVKRLGIPETAQTLSADAMVDWTITPDLSLTNSGRLDFVSPSNVGAYVYHTITAYSFNTGLVYKAGADDTLRLLAGRSNQIPSMLMLLRVPGIKPSSLMKYQGTWDHALATISSTVHASVYYQSITRTMVYGVLNGGDVSSTGVEASLQGANTDGWSWNGSINYRTVGGGLHFTPSSALGYALDFEKTMPKCILTFGLGKTFGDFEANVEGKWSSESQDWAPVYNSKTFVNVPDYLTMTARIGYRINDNFSVAVTAAQLNRETVFEGANNPDKRRFMATLTASL